VFVDLVHLGRLLRPGAILLLDDYHLPGIARAASFFQANLGWTLEEVSTIEDRHHHHRLLTTRPVSCRVPQAPWVRAALTGQAALTDRRAAPGASGRPATSRREAFPVAGSPAWQRQAPPAGLMPAPQGEHGSGPIRASSTRNAE
jgi:hypothetical protein